MGNSEIVLSKVEQSDVDVFFQHMQEPDAIFMAAFTSEDPSDRNAHDQHWDRVLGNPAILARTIHWQDRVVGHVASFDRGEQREVTYWIGQEYWGRGIAGRALAEFLQLEATRPLYARVAHDNVGSIRVLQKNGFEICGTDQGFANARNAEVEEFILVLSP